MANQLPVATQRRLLKLEQRVFKLEQQILRERTKHEKQVAALEEENRKVRSSTSIVLTEERIAELQERRKAALVRQSKPITVRAA